MVGGGPARPEIGFSPFRSRHRSFVLPSSRGSGQAISSRDESIGEREREEEEIAGRIRRRMSSILGREVDEPRREERESQPITVLMNFRGRL